MWFFSKTCRVLEHSMLVSTLDDYSGPLPHWGMMHSGGITALKTLARPTFVIGGSAWPSPSATDTRVRAAPSHPHLTKNGTLRHINKAGTQSAIRLSQAVKFFDGGVGELNPDWVETLMGYPPDWTDISGPPAPTTRKQDRANRLKALGNAVVPQVVLPIATAIVEWLDTQSQTGQEEKIA